ncbi:MAG TPA: hypothetical protein VMU69_13530 [Bradyrhizobium sp.]|nr:hypothetical protein [Bradyrhizobium sp.]
MKKMLLAGAIAFIAAGGAAFAQPSQGQAGAQAGVNGNAPTAPDAIITPDYTIRENMRPGVTTGMDNGVVEPDRMPEAPVMQSPSDGESSRGNLGPGTMTREPR